MARQTTTTTWYASGLTDHLNRTTKHSDTTVNFAREAQTNEFVKLVYVPTTEQLADGMIEALPPSLSQSICLDHYLHRFEFEPRW